MNTTIATSPTNWNRARMALSLGLTGLVLALATAGAGGAFDRGEASVDTKAATPIEVIDLRSGDLRQLGIPARATISQPATTYFLVASEEQHDFVVAQQAELHSVSSQPVVLVAGTPRLSAEAHEMIEEGKARWLSCCQASRFEVIDLRVK